MGTSLTQPLMLKLKEYYEKGGKMNVKDSGLVKLYYCVYIEIVSPRNNMKVTPWYLNNMAA